ncbi:RecX family transcriptional regulator [bacterium]|nr:RecX family transcriptional regulator [bacterium]
MIRIESIRKEKRIYTIKIQKDFDTFTFKITEDLLIESRFLSLKEITNEEFTNFLNRLPYDQILQQGIKYLEKKPHSKKETSDHLREYTSSSSIIKEVINTLEKKNYLNDEYYKQTLIDYEIYEKHSGENIITMKLKENKLSPEFLYPDDIKKQNILYLTNKFNQTSKKESRKIKIEKCKIFLLRKGYKEEDISKYFDESKIDSCDNELIKIEKERLLKKYAGDTIKVKKALIRKGLIDNI